ncbi:MAG: methyltransferase domain-containing protein, partial [Planctomycetales bacterium]
NEQITTSKPVPKSAKLGQTIFMIQPTQKIPYAHVSGQYDDHHVYNRQFWGEHLHHGLWLTGRETLSAAIEQLMNYVADQLNLGSTGGHVCDVGCGYGGTSRYLAMTRGWQMTGLTISGRQYDYATGENGERHTGNPRFLLRNWEENNLDPNSFDGVVSIECVSHVEDKQRFFDELYRVLKPGCRAVVIAWLAGDRPSRFNNNWLLEPICREGRLPAMGTSLDYQRLVADAGLRLIRVEDLSRQVRKTWRVCIGKVAQTILFSPVGWRFLFTTRSSHTVFVSTLTRILAAYYCGAMKYGQFVMEKPACRPTPSRVPGPTLIGGGPGGSGLRFWQWFSRCRSLFAPFCWSRATRPT